MISFQHHLALLGCLLFGFMLPALGQNCTRPRPGLVDPRTLYRLNYTLPPQSFPVLQSDFEIPPNCGETSYIGTGRLAGRRALITGGDSGIGRAVAIAYAREGADVVINYLPEEEPDAQEVISTITSTTAARIFAIPGNLRNETFCNHLVTRAADLLGGLDILVNNAGYSRVSFDIATHSLEHFNQTIETNIYAPFWLSRAARPLLGPGSSIIFTASGIIQSPPGQQLDYAASKAFVHTFSQALAAQLTPAGIRVNAVAPALVFSPFLATQGMTNEFMQEAGAASPMGRVEQPVELAPLYVGLAENAASYVSGSLWTAGGGQN